MIKGPYLTKIQLFKLSFAFMALSFIGCSAANNNAMQIRYTSVNDIYANYVFNFKDNATGIKQLYDFAVKDLQASKRYRDSVLQTGLQADPRENRPLKAEAVIFYRPPGALQGQPDSTDILLYCGADETSYELNGIDVPACKYVAQAVDGTTIGFRGDSVYTLQFKNAELNLGVLKATLDKIEALKYHLNKPLFTYKIVGADSKELLSLIYSNNGKTLKMLFPNDH